MDYTEWSSLKIGDRVIRTHDTTNLQGTIISDVGVGYVVKWDNGETKKITDGLLSKVKYKQK